MTLTFVTVDGQRTSAGAAAALRELKAAFRQRFGLDLLLTSGYRTTAEQEAIFRARYRPNAHSPYGDYRWWRGTRWGRVSPEGTVAVPGTSRHEKASAVDLRDSGSDAGVTIAGTPRANWLKANAPRYGFHPTGYSFGEPWHYDYNGSHDAPATGGPVPSKPAPTQPEPAHDPREETMKGYSYKDGNNTIHVLFNEVSGFYVRHTGVPADYNNAIARQWGTGSWPVLTKKHDVLIEEQCRLIREKK